MKILIICPSRDIFKKKSDQIILHKQLNFGILSIASTFPNNIIIYDCQGKSKEFYTQEIVEIIESNGINLVGISLISAYSENCAFSIARYLKTHRPQTLVVFGGKDYVPFIAEHLLEENLADIVVNGEGESFFFDYIVRRLKLTNCSGAMYLHSGKLIQNLPNHINNDLVPYNHSLYPDYQDFVPSIEISRGCNNDCLFCTNNKSKQRTKDIRLILEEIEVLQNLYQENICIYFQTPHFLMNRDALKTLIEYRKNYNDKFTWRTQTRVEYLNPERIKLLYLAGARVIDVGFESASPVILKNMHKTKNPLGYISKMKESLLHASKIGLRLKINIMLYARETKESLKETYEFLSDNLHNFHSFSAYPLMIYPSHKSKEFINSILLLGGTINHTQEKSFIHSVNLNTNISYEKSLEIALLFGKSLQSQEMYFSQRLYGYLPMNQNCHHIQYHDDLPFYTDLNMKKQMKENLFSLLNEI